MLEILTINPQTILIIAAILIPVFTAFILFTTVSKSRNLGHAPGTYTVQGLDKDDNVIGEIDVQARNRYEAAGKADADLQAYAYLAKKKERVES